MSSERRRPNVEFIEIKGLGRPVGAYTPVVSVRNARLIYLAGKVSVDAEGKVVGAGDIEAQCRQALINLKAGLAAAGARLEDVIKINVYLADRAYTSAWRRVRDEFFKPPLPASTGVVVGLALEEFLIEVEAVAAVAEPE